MCVVLNVAVFCSSLMLFFTFHVHCISIVRSLCRVFTTTITTTTTTNNNNNNNNNNTTTTTISFIMVITSVIIVIVAGGSWNDNTWGTNGPGSACWGPVKVEVNSGVMMALVRVTSRVMEEALSEVTLEVLAEDQVNILVCYTCLLVIFMHVEFSISVHHSLEVYVLLAETEVISNLQKKFLYLVCRCIGFANKQNGDLEKALSIWGING